MPHSHESRISKSCRALRFWATVLLRGSTGPFALDLVAATFGTVPATVLHLDEIAYAQMIGHCYDGLPLEACGLLAAPKGSTDAATRCYPTRNAAKSSRVYEVHGMDYQRADDDAEANGLEL